MQSEYVEGEETSDEKHAWSAISFDNAEHSWTRSVLCRHLGFSCAHAKAGAIFITVEDLESQAPVSKITGGRRYAFNVDGAFTLMQGLKSDHGRHDYVSGSRAPGPNVWRNAVSTNMHADIGPHHRWASGQLYENIEGQAENGGQFAVQNRASSGSGHGWAGNAVLFFNSRSVCTSMDRTRCWNGFTVDSPASGAGINWGIGLVADKDVPVELYQSGYRGNNFALTTTCRADGTDAPYVCCVASHLAKLKTAASSAPQAYAVGGHWQSKGAPLADIPSLYAKQLAERFTPEINDDGKTEDEKASSCTTVDDCKVNRGAQWAWTCTHMGLALLPACVAVRNVGNVVED